MGRAGPSIIGLAVTMAMLAVMSAGPMKLLGFGRSAPGDEAAEAASGPGGGDAAALGALHASDQVERDRLVAQIQSEFGIAVGAERLASHHAARDYLERLRLAQRAGELGVEVDPESFGDDEFMRRYLAERVPGGAQALAVARQPVVGVIDQPSGLSRSDYVFINGRRYYPDGSGAYVDANGAVLLTSPNQKQPRGSVRAAAERADRRGLPGGSAGSLGDLDALLEMLMPAGGGE